MGKLVFKNISQILNLSEIQCYTLYIDKGLDFHLDFRFLTKSLQTDPNIAKQFYGDDDSPPKFFDYQQSSDWARLNNNLFENVNEYVCFYRSSSRTLHKVFDECTITKLFEKETMPINPTCDTSYENNYRKHIFTLHCKDNKYNLVYTFDDSKNFKNVPHPKLSEEKFILKLGFPSFKASETLGYIINYLEDVTNQLCYPSPFPLLTFNEITNDLTLFSNFDFPILIVSHTGSILHKRQNYQCTDDNFTTLAFYNEENENEIKVICMTICEDGKFMAYIPYDSIKKIIISKCVTSVGRITDINDYFKEKANICAQNDTDYVKEKKKN